MAYDVRRRRLQRLRRGIASSASVFFLRPTAYIILLAILSAPSSSVAQPVPDTLSGPPREPGRTFVRPDLVELTRLDSTIHLDIHYARSDNFMGRPMYTQARAFLQRPAAMALVRVNAALRRTGYGLMVFDAYRPWAVTKKFWDETSPSKRAFVADPRRGSIHNRGCAVDLTLYDRSTGQELAMPSAFDEFSRRASPRYQGGTSVERGHRDLLRRAMEAGGFSVNRGEWWHFDFTGWSSYPILDVPFEAVSGKN